MAVKRLTGGNALSHNRKYWCQLLPVVWQKEPVHISFKVACVPKEDTDQSAPCSMITVFAGHSVCCRGSKASSGGKAKILISLRVLNLRWVHTQSSQQAHNIKMTSYQRRCDVITSHRRWYDVILTLCAHWVVGNAVPRLKCIRNQ